MKALFALAALLTATQSGEAPRDGAIDFSFSQSNGFWSGSMHFRIEPDGALTIETSRPDPSGDAAAPAVRENFRREAGFTGYRRIAALLAPLRTRKADVTCPRPDAGPDPIGISTPEVIATVQWEADGTRIGVPITCRFGAAQDDAELARAAIDEVKRWINEGSDAAFDGAANAIEVTAPGGED